MNFGLSIQTPDLSYLPSLLCVIYICRGRNLLSVPAQIAKSRRMEKAWNLFVQSLTQLSKIFESWITRLAWN